MKKTVLATMVAATAITSMPALARPPHWAPAHGYRSHDGDIEYRRTDNGIRYWRGEDGRYYCRRGDGTVGLLAGAVVGALLGRAVDTRGERTTGTILGAAAGALIGNELAKGPSRCR
ncbi:glycine zipper 2TM domain-containing protein [Novosphingobium sp.]|mgnify:CR=1 FL=1|uniref:glycine zipper 2TM domain-containing protein n=1 Tax=Novosphingobium sp. TaxID=1874826 RepID=UPI0025F8C2B3|nr:glycine zipper 2TM domain-containing protein [Novosphingobium sp.]MCC6925410.1 glycine zipper 2TM domain-containing protein [Novosphingobium sp.]